MKPTRSHGRQSARPSLKPRALMQDTPDYADVWQARIVMPMGFSGSAKQRTHKVSNSSEPFPTMTCEGANPCKRAIVSRSN